MSEHATYLWVVEWDDRFVRPKRVELRRVTRLPGVSDEDLERHLIDVEIPAQARASTRVGGVTRQVLLKLTGDRTQATAFGNAAEGVATPLGSLAVAVGTDSEVVWSSDASPQGDAPT